MINKESLKKLKSILSLGLVLIFTQACTKEEPIPIPAYIFIDQIQFESQNATSEGGSTSNISDAWVWVDEQLIGTNTLPMTIPVLHNDATSSNIIRVAAGIKDNGIGNTRLSYPFYSRYEVSKDLESGETVTVTPIIGYNEDVKIKIVDAFEDPGIVFGFDIDENPNTDIIKSTEDVLEGTHSGKFVFDDIENTCELATSVQYQGLQPASLGASAVYLEIDYKTNVPLYVGLGSYYGGELSNIAYDVGLNPRDEWNKVYINLTEDVFGANASSYIIALKAFKTDSIPNPQIFVDNIKLLHY
ncbi:MAG: hypothetical protein MK212_00060 [Saprospiraceae bacterium]|nr:hypothetical protein [Saprospiraceae bacterium]